MTGPVFVDTNVLLCLLDEADLISRKSFTLPER